MVFFIDRPSVDPDIFPEFLKAQAAHVIDAGLPETWPDQIHAAIVGVCNLLACDHRKGVMYKVSIFRENL